MGRVHKQDCIVAILLNVIEDGERAAHYVNTEDPAAIVAGARGGITCNYITPLETPTYDGAQTKVVTLSLKPWGIERGVGRVKETTDEIIVLFKEAGINAPKVEPQRRFSKYLNRALRQFAKPATAEAC